MFYTTFTPDWKLEITGYRPDVPADPGLSSMEDWTEVYGSILDKMRHCERGEVDTSSCVSPSGMVQASYPFQMIARDHIPSLSRSFIGNTYLSLRVDPLFKVFHFKG